MRVTSSVHSDAQQAALQAWRDIELIYAELVRPMLQGSKPSSVSPELERGIALARQEADTRRAAYFAQLRRIHGRGSAWHANCDHPPA